MNSKNKYYLILLLPWILTLLIFWAYPLFHSIILSFSEYKTFSGDTNFVGFENYSLLFSDDAFISSVKNTFIFVFGTVPLTTALAIYFAIKLDNITKFKNMFRSIFFIPSITSLVVISLVFTSLYSGDGYINSLLEMIGAPFPEKGWLLSESAALYSIMAMDVWMSVGYYMILFLASLQTIPKQLFESAEIMGAGKFQQFKSITWLHLRPTLIFVLLVNTIKSFQVFIEIYVMTKGGPLGSTSTIVYYIFDKAFNKIDLIGLASASAVLLFLGLIVFSIIQSRVLKNN
jgi:multiple sugar transport system permease protein